MGDLQSLCWPVRTRREALQDPSSSSASSSSFLVQFSPVTPPQCFIQSLLHSLPLLVLPLRHLLSVLFFTAPFSAYKVLSFPPFFFSPHSFNTPSFLLSFKFSFTPSPPVICLGLGLVSHLFSLPLSPSLLLCFGWVLLSSSYYILSPAVLTSIFLFNVLRALHPLCFFFFFFFASHLTTILKLKPCHKLVILEPCLKGFWVFSSYSHSSWIIIQPHLSLNHNQALSSLPPQ